jgi:Uma2 family endonuclease
MTQAATFTRQLAGRDRVTYEEFLRLTDGMHAEWVDGEVVLAMPVSGTHDEMQTWLLLVLGAFLQERPLGKLRHDPFQMKTGPDLPGRAPDLIFVANEHLERLRENYLDGPADLAVEIVSKGKASLDYVEKFREYEAGGVGEYWIIDPANETADFFVLARGRFERAQPEAGGVYRSAVVPGFWLEVGWLWERSPLASLLPQLLRTATGS